MDSESLQAIVAPLLEWYDRHARILPWRESPEPYRVWISEIMLQQTRVEAVKPYYDRFLKELPDLHALAEAPEPQLLKLWEGLGYYNRVRNLQKAARVIVSEYGGEFPRDVETLRSLPGIGEYTAGAIASISFNRPEPAVDGNVLRVVSRLAASREDISSPKVKGAISDALRQVYPAGRCGDFTQSLMELGATVCLPNGAPRCAECPLAELCAGRREGIAAGLPVKPGRKPRRIEPRTVFLLRCGDRIALLRRPGSGLLAGLWEFPNTAGSLTVTEAAEWMAGQGIFAERIIATGGAKHVFTHLEWHMSGFLADCKAENGGFHWVTRDELEREISLPTAFRPFVEALDAESAQPSLF